MSQNATIETSTLPPNNGSTRRRRVPRRVASESAEARRDKEEAALAEAQAQEAAEADAATEANGAGKAAKNSLAPFRGRKPGKKRGRKPGPQKRAAKIRALTGEDEQLLGWLCVKAMEAGDPLDEYVAALRKGIEAYDVARAHAEGATR